MPEGPEIRRVADRLAAAIVGERASAVRFGIDRLRDRGAELAGRRIEGVEPRGKALLTRFEGGLSLYSHNQLYGRWYVCAPERPPQTDRSLRVAIETPRRWALLYSASDVELLDDDELDEHPFLARIGPDVLDPGTTPGVLRGRLADPRFRSRALGALLLDQTFVAGLGNYLRSEILFFAGLGPAVRPADLDAPQLAHLARTIRAVARRSYRTGGVTELAAEARAAKRAGEPRSRYRHAVFHRADEPCRRCGTRVQRREVCGRRLYLCPRCQGRG